MPATCGAPSSYEASSSSRATNWRESTSARRSVLGRGGNCGSCAAPPGGADDDDDARLSRRLPLVLARCRAEGPRPPGTTPWGPTTRGEQLAGQLAEGPTTLSADNPPIPDRIQWYADAPFAPRYPLPPCVGPPPNPSATAAKPMAVATILVRRTGGSYGCESCRVIAMKAPIHGLSAPHNLCFFFFFDLS